MLHGNKNLQNYNTFLVKNANEKIVGYHFQMAGKKKMSTYNFISRNVYFFKLNRKIRTFSDLQKPERIQHETSLQEMRKSV